MTIDHKWIVSQSIVCTVENEQIRFVSFSVAEILYEEIKRLRMQINCEKYPEMIAEENEYLRQHIRELEKQGDKHGN